MTTCVAIYDDSELDATLTTTFGIVTEPLGSDPNLARRSQNHQ